MNGSCRPGYHVISIPPPRPALRHQRLREPGAEFIKNQARYPILVTIQPNLGRSSSPIRLAPGLPSTPANKAWAIVKTTFYRLDRERTRCPKPALLPPEHRLQGVAVLEKHGTNPHAHVLINCQSFEDQLVTGMFLFEKLDNVPKARNDYRDEQWQQDTWDKILDRGGPEGDLLLCRNSSMLTAIAPAGSAMVQIVRDGEDLEKVSRYMTKTWFETQHGLSARANTPSNEEVMDWKLLSDFHAAVDPARYARRDRFDRLTGLPTSTNVNATWKSDGVRIRS